MALDKCRPVKNNKRSKVYVSSRGEGLGFWAHGFRFEFELAAVI